MELLYALIGFALGGLLKGATGAGAPVIAIPILAATHNVPFAVSVMVLPNMVTNFGQLWVHRKSILPAGFTATFAVAGGIGAALGTWLLANLPHETLSLTVAGVVIAYIVFRLFKPDWRAPWRAALRLAAPVGVIAGMLQGASGISAPVSITFLNSLKLERPAFISTISVFFIAMSTLQIPALWAAGLLDRERAVMSVVACVVIFAFMQVGARLARNVSKEVFDRVMLAFLGVFAVKIIVTALI